MTKASQNNKGMFMMHHNIRQFSSLPDHLTLEMPNLSPTMEKGNIGAWHKAVGDTIAPGDVLCSIETDKATVDYEMQDEGFVAKLMYEAGTKDIPLGKVLAIIVDDADDIPAFANYTASDEAPATPAASTPAPEAPKAAAPSAPTPAATSSPAAAKASGDRIFASPMAQSLAKASNVSLDAIKGTGPEGRIIKADVEAAIASGGAKAAPMGGAVSAPVFDTVEGGFVDFENSNIRKVIADRLTYSKQNIPHYYVSYSMQVDNLMKLRAKLNKVSATKLSVNDFVIKAASMAAIKVPETNSSWMTEYIR